MGTKGTWNMETRRVIPQQYFYVEHDGKVRIAIRNHSVLQLHAETWMLQEMFFTVVITSTPRTG